MYCTFNYVYSGKNLTFRSNILLQSSGCSRDEGTRCLRNVGKSLPGQFIPQQAAFFVVSTMMKNLIILRILLTSLAIFIYDKYNN